MKRLLVYILLGFFGTHNTAIASFESTDSLPSTSSLKQEKETDSLKRAAQDSIWRNLDELIVDGKTTRIVESGIEVTPDRKEKKSAYDAVSLLDRMSISRIKVDKDKGKVTTIFGAAVSMFIDYNPASGEDLDGLRPDDVLSVQVLQYPENPKFNGAPYVVNFIMKKYEWGGYTKFTAIGQTLNYDNGIGRVYSKFVRKKLTVDGNISASVTHRDKYESQISESFRDVYVGDVHYDLIKKDRISGIDYLKQDNSQLASMRIAYNSDKSFIEHRIRFSRLSTPTSRDYAEVAYSPSLFDSSQSLSTLSNQSIMPSVNGYYYFSFPKKNSLSVTWYVSFNRNKRESYYQLGALSPTINDNSEWAYPFNASVSYSKKFKRNNTFRTSLNTFNTYYDTDYSGSYNGNQKVLSSESFLFLEYMQNWNSRLNLYTRIGMSYVIGRINGCNYLKEWNPRIGFQLNYNINSKHAASVEGWWGNSHPDPSTANTAIVRSNELLWVEGNPELTNVLFATARATYTYMPLSNFNLYGVLEYTGNPNKLAQEYRVVPGYDGFVRKYVNSGDFNQYSAQLSATLKLFKNSLSINGGGSFNRVVLTGMDAQRHTILKGWVNINGYIGNFSLGMYYETPEKEISAWSFGELLSIKSVYGANLSYSIGDLRCGISYNNWFSKGFGDFNNDSEHYSRSGRMYFPNLGSNLRVNIVYTLSYGKKVKRNNELDTDISSSSAVLK